MASRHPEAERTSRPESPSRLTSTLVRYTDRSDRRTVYPPTTTSVARMTTWLAADADVFVDLEAMR